MSTGREGSADKNVGFFWELAGWNLFSQTRITFDLFYVFGLVLYMTDKQASHTPMLISFYDSSMFRNTVTKYTLSFEMSVGGMWFKILNIKDLTEQVCFYLIKHLNTKLSL